MSPGRSRAALLFGALLSVNASYTLLIPFVPDLEERAGANPTVVALTFAVFAGAKAAAQPFGGMWVDRWRPGDVGCVALLIAAAGIVVTAIARDPATLLAGRALWGVGEGLVTPALYAGMAALCRRYDLPTSRMMGNFGTFAVAGFLLGPLAAGIAAPFGLDALFLFGAAVTAVTAFGLRWAVPRDVPAPVDEEQADDTAAGTAATGGRWWTWVLALGALDLFTNLTYSALEPVLPLYLSADGAESARGAISLVFAIGLAAFGVVSWLLGRYASRLGLVAMAVVGLAFAAVGTAGLYASAEVWPVAACFVVLMVGQAALYLTARRGVVELRSAMTRQGKAFGLFGLVSDIGNILGPLLGVALYELTGRVSFLVIGALSGLLLAALVVGARRSRAVPGPPVEDGHVRTVVLFDRADPLELESGRTLAPVTVAYETYGELNEDRSNAIFVCHALTGDSHPAAHHPDDRPGWWRDMVGPGCPVDTDRHFVVCANVLAGCSGTTGPTSPGPDGGPWGPDFPLIGITDMVTVHRALVAELGLGRLRAVIGGSLGGMQVLEWLLRAPDDADDFLIVAGTARHTAENLAWNAVARTAIRSDPEFREGRYPPGGGPAAGLGTARMIGHLTYVSEDMLARKFGREPRAANGTSPSVTTGPFAVEGYLEHQAASLVGRFDANSYLCLMNAMDSFDAFADDRPVAPFRRRPGVHLFSFDSDRLYGPDHARYIQANLAARGLPAEHHQDHTTDRGHDAFLLRVPPYLRRVAEVLGQESVVRSADDAG
ncbi:homoserine O-acetyltransferase MetX [Saccharothrix texasensis]|uniref:Homoserine O-acetyltransferase n=1 Tax=Saccharothrix texasensis TaxID=103734 RepID=A0A3N1H065_9PSEU|nr:homoserine O-acetyltransferase [Saccharothrix texasensis]ROP35776.1 homoserine O-acetyltransferase [Saccharothrix texasensis]